MNGMAWEKLFRLSPWRNLPNKTTPLGESRLNPQRDAIDGLDDRVIYLYDTKLDKETANGMVSNITYNESNGVFTVSYLNGQITTLDTKLEKLAVNFDYDPVTQVFSITLDDGTVIPIDLSALITQYEFLNSDTIAFSVDTDGKVTAIVKEGSIQEKHLQPNYLGDIRIETARAEVAAREAAVSETAAKASEVAAKASETAAAASEQVARQSETNALASEQAAAASETAAAASEVAAKASEVAAAASEANARQSETNALASEQAARQSETNALASEQAAAASATAAGQSEVNALASEQAAEASKVAAKASEQAAKQSEINAFGSADVASNKATSAINSAANAATSATAAQLSEQTASAKASEAATSATTATNKATESSASADLARSYAVGTGNVVRPNDATDNSKAYAEAAKKSAETAEMVSKINLPKFWIDFATGELLASFDKPLNFFINNEGELVVEIFELEVA